VKKQFLNRFKDYDMKKKTTLESNLQLCGMWDKSGSQYKCRYLITWLELSSTEMAGTVCGYSGGACFQFELYYARHSDHELTSLIIDGWETITGTSNDYLNDTPDDMHQILYASQEEIYNWNDKDIWYDEDRLILRPELIKDLNADRGNLYLHQDSHPLLRSILGHVGVTARPVFT
jgi:hypothetical protein|tara:strand:+ start:340 stop:867 length:528 start_codon:yes stop_codon:yes gene_type:complete